MIENLRPSLEANALAIEDMTEKVRQGWPYGLLATVAGRPYAAALLHRAAGCLPVATVDSARIEVEAEVARASLCGPVVADVSIFVVGVHLRHVWPQLRASFSRLELPRPAHQDVLDAVERFRAPSDGTLYFDTSGQVLRGAETDPIAQQRLLELGEWVAAEAADVVVADWPHLVAVNDGLVDDTFLSWLSALDMARARGLPLWCDDLGLRTLALNEGVRGSERPH